MESYIEIEKDANPYRTYKSDLAYLDANSYKDASDIGKKTLRRFEEFILQEGYPCVGAQAAVHGKTYALGVFDKMNSISSLQQWCYGLYTYLDEMKERPSNFLTYIAIFREERFASEVEFEKGLWSALNELHRMDKEHFDWCDGVSQNPASTEFSFSFGGKAFFLVGMHPKSSRKARRFVHPAVAFNWHSQFSDLRDKGRFEVMKNAIRQNELKFQGSINPMLADFGKGLEAPQYSGRKVDSSWKCPFLNNR